MTDTPITTEAEAARMMADALRAMLSAEKINEAVSRRGWEALAAYDERRLMNYGRESAP